MKFPCNLIQKIQTENVFLKNTKPLYLIYIFIKILFVFEIALILTFKPRFLTMNNHFEFPSAQPIKGFFIIQTPILKISKNICNSQIQI